MAGPRKKKYTSGEGNQYWTRGTALRKLQLSLKDFRRLCILKGIYPREPRNRKKAQKGTTGIKTLYNKKDIQFLMHEPIIWKFREIKVHGRKIGRAKALREHGLAKRLMNKQITLNLDHIVKERYPTFLDALRDLDDCLTLCTLFATFPSLRHVPRDHSVLCRRLVLEFCQAVIAARALRKVFISIKGYYFQAEIRGELITWVMPHQFSFEPQTKEEVDFRIMSTFIQFYIVLLGFVNFRLYHNLNLHYPPKTIIASDYEEGLVDKKALEAERVAALNIPLLRAPGTEEAQEDSPQLDNFTLGQDENDKMEQAFVEAEKIRKLKTLFKGMKVFLNREVPREPLVFILRCFGAEVSWDRVLFVGATFDETDETITHQVVDRPQLETQFMSRYYVQPQWVFDSVNARELLPVQKYLPGCVLPPHLSPFVDETRTQYYTPPEALQPIGTSSQEGVSVSANGQSNHEVNSAEEEKAMNDVSDEDEMDVEKDSEEEESGRGEEEEGKDEAEEEETESGGEDEEEDDKERKRKQLMKKMSVSQGKLEEEDPKAKLEAERQEMKLRERMVEKKYRALFKSMKKGRAERVRDLRQLERKRALLEQRRMAKT